MRWKTSWSSVFVLVAACSTSGDWTRDATSREAMEADLLACDSAARATPTVPHPRAGAGRVATDPPDADHQLDLAQRVERCMRGRGYTFQRARRLLM
jgi:hypothetical protein